MYHGVMRGAILAVFSQRGSQSMPSAVLHFPVRIEGAGSIKRPMNRGWQRTGLRGSKELARKFPDADALGVNLGPRNNLMLVDIDTKDERALADALSIYGDTPIISRTASKSGFHAWYRYSDDAWKNYRKARRAVRPDRTRPLDFLANGVAVVPPSIGPAGQYEFIHGGLADLGALKPLAHPVPAETRDGGVPEVSLPVLPTAAGNRNNATWRHAMRVARVAANLERLIQEITAYNESHNAPPLGQEELMTICESAWRYTANNQNRFGQHGAYFATDEVVSMRFDQDAFFLLAFLRAHQGHGQRSWSPMGLEIASDGTAKGLPLPVGA
jgi:Bifunctional DNA primase/polymerase, N-terminal/Primase C terminal 1 (PriCT-1)